MAVGVSSGLHPATYVPPSDFRVTPSDPWLLFCGQLLLTAGPDADSALVPASGLVTGRPRDSPGPSSRGELHSGPVKGPQKTAADLPKAERLTSEVQRPRRGSPRPACFSPGRAFPFMMRIQPHLDKCFLPLGVKPSCHCDCRELKQHSGRSVGCRLRPPTPSVPTQC